MAIKKFKVRVGGIVESEKMYGILVDVVLGPKPNDFSASRQEWFPKSLCEIERVINGDSLPSNYLTAPEWLLKAKKVKYA